MARTKSGMLGHYTASTAVAAPRVTAVEPQVAAAQRSQKSHQTSFKSGTAKRRIKPRDKSTQPRSARYNNSTKLTPTCRTRSAPEWTHEAASATKRSLELSSPNIQGNTRKSKGLNVKLGHYLSDENELTGLILDIRDESGAASAMTAAHVLRHHSHLYSSNPLYATKKHVNHVRRVLLRHAK